MLLVDDETDFVRILQKRMNKRGLDVTAAASGPDAVSILRKKDFDVAGVDFKMEKMDGLEVLKVFKLMVPSMPVIMLTGHGSSEAAQEGLRRGAFAYMIKPCDLETLIKKIREAAKGGG